MRLDIFCTFYLLYIYGHLRFFCELSVHGPWPFGTRLFSDKSINESSGLPPPHGSGNERTLDLEMILNFRIQARITSLTVHVPLPFFYTYFYILLCVYVCLWVHTTYVQCLQRSEEGVRSLGFGVRELWTTQNKCWELNSGPLLKQWCAFNLAPTVWRHLPSLWCEVQATYLSISCYLFIPTWVKELDFCVRDTWLNCLS